jgi:hypothetical protein
MKVMGRPTSTTTTTTICTVLRPLRLGLVLVLLALSTATMARAHNATACSSCSSGDGPSWCAPPSIGIQADVCVDGQGTAGQNGSVAFQSYLLDSSSGQWYLSFFASASCSASSAVVSFGPCALQECCSVDFQLEGQAAAFTQLVVDEAPVEPSRAPRPPSGASHDQAPTWFIFMIAGLVCMVLVAGCVGWMVHLAQKLKRRNYHILSAQQTGLSGSNDELRVLPLA